MLQLHLSDQQFNYLINNKIYLIELEIFHNLNIVAILKMPSFHMVTGILS